MEKNVRSLKEDDLGKAYRSLKRMGAQPGDCSNEGSFTLISHMEENLTNDQSIESIAQHFALISQEYPPLDSNMLPEQVKVKLDTPISPEMLPDIFDFKVYEQIKKIKETDIKCPWGSATQNSTRIWA